MTLARWIPKCRAYAELEELGIAGLSGQPEQHEFELPIFYSQLRL